jgi:hypothetical protein
LSVLSGHRPSRRSGLIAAVALAVLLVVGGVAYAAGTQQPATKTFTPRSANQITNLDVLRQQIRNYYGDPLGTGVSPEDSNYAREASSVAAAGQRWLGASHHTRGTRATVLDVDDTTLLTWNYEIFSNWAFTRPPTRPSSPSSTSRPSSAWSTWSAPPSPRATRSSS